MFDRKDCPRDSSQGEESKRATELVAGQKLSATQPTGTMASSHEQYAQGSNNAEKNKKQINSNKAEERNCGLSTLS